MSENLNKIPVFTENAVVTIEVGAGLYVRFHQLLWVKVSKKTPEEFQALITHLKEGGKPRDESEYEIESLLALLYEIETAAKEQGKIVYKDPSDPIKS